VVLRLYLVLISTKYFVKLVLVLVFKYFYLVLMASLILTTLRLCMYVAVCYRLFCDLNIVLLSRRSGEIGIRLFRN